MNLETFVDKVGELLKDGEFRAELEKGLSVQLTIDKERTKVIALKPRCRPAKPATT